MRIMLCLMLDSCLVGRQWVSERGQGSGRPCVGPWFCAACSEVRDLSLSCLSRECAKEGLFKRSGWMGGWDSEWLGLAWTG